MNKYKRLTYLFAVLAILLSDVMCPAVANSYCMLQMGGRYGLCSAPAYVAFFQVIPYGVGIVICIILACFFNRKRQKSL